MTSFLVWVDFDPEGEAVGSLWWDWQQFTETRKGYRYERRKFRKEPSQK